MVCIATLQFCIVVSVFPRPPRLSTKCQYISNRYLRSMGEEFAKQAKRKRCQRFSNNYDGTCLCGYQPNYKFMHFCQDIKKKLVMDVFWRMPERPRTRKAAA
nr:AKR_HP1_G0028220.mRNA.1.CDS.1 [Saccharomyces cerevisiae]